MIRFPFLGELSALLAAISWSVSSMAFASATKRVGSFQVNIARLVLAATYALLIVLLLQLDVHLSSTQFFKLALSGAVGLVLGDIFLFKAFRDIGARLTMLVMSLVPAIAAFLAYATLGEQLTITGMLGIIITLLGISIVVLQPQANGSTESSTSSAGLFYAVLAAIGQGSGLVLAKLAFRESPVNGFVATTVRILASLIILLPFTLATGRNPYGAFSRDKKAFLLTVLGSLFGPFLGITFSLIAVAHTNVGIAATIMGIVPVLMLPLVKLVHREVLSWRAVLGAIVAVNGVAILFLR